MNFKNNNNINYNYNLTDINELVGGYNQEWKKVLERLGQKHIKHFKPQSIGDIMGVLKYDLKNIKRTDFPIFLNPKTATFKDVAIHGKIRQYLSDSTIEKNLRYARFMETHPSPIDFCNLTPENFIMHMDYRLEIEDPPATAFALENEKKALIMFLRAFGISDKRWTSLVRLPPRTTNSDAIEVPFPSTMNKFFSYEYSDNIYENRLFQSITFLGFMFGMRPPSEIINLNIEDLTINKDGTGYIKIHEQKKRSKNRIIIPFNKSVLSSPVFKSPKNYVENWRRKVENSKSGNALFLQPDGRRVTGKYIRSYISPAGKKIAGQYFHLYTMRHTFATYLYDYTKDIKFVSNMLGHTKIDTTNKYVHIADCMTRQLGNNNLFNLALRSRINVRVNQDKIDCLGKIDQSKKITPVRISGLDGI